MSKSAVLLIAAALASGAAWAQQATDQAAARANGTQGARGVITGGSADGGIALQTDAARANATVPAISGGVSLNARDNLRAREGNANLKMVFALNTGNYISDVHVKVVDSKGRVVMDDVSNGPWVLARLPAGSYTATATYNGHAVTQRFSAGKGLHTAQFRWPASVEQQSVGAAAADAGGQILGTGPEELR